MFKCTLVGRTGGMVNVKDVEFENGDKGKQAVFTVFTEERGKKMAVRCIMRGAKIEKRIAMLMIPNDKKVEVAEGEEATGSKAKYYSRLVAIDGRVAMDTRLQELPIVGETAPNGDPWIVPVEAPSMCVFIDGIQVLDANPDPEKKVTSSSNIPDDVKKRLFKTKSELKELRDTDDTDDIEADTEEESNTEEPAKETKKTAKRKGSKKKDKENLTTENLDELLTK